MKDSGSTCSKVATQDNFLFCFYHQGFEAIPKIKESRIATADHHNDSKHDRKDLLQMALMKPALSLVRIQLYIGMPARRTLIA